MTILTKEETKRLLTYVTHFNVGPGVLLERKEVEDFRKWTVKDILKEKNAEKRRIKILIYNHHHKNVDAFLIDGGCKEVKGPQGPTDYQHATIVALDVGDEIIYYLRFVNRTIEESIKELLPTMSAQEKKKRGLTPEGYKLYYLECGKPEDYEDMRDACARTFQVGRWAISNDFNPAKYNNKNLDEAAKEVFTNNKLTPEQKMQEFQNLLNHTHIYNPDTES